MKNRETNRYKNTTFDNNAFIGCPHSDYGAAVGYSSAKHIKKIGRTYRRQL
jgi:hypothetical protein